MQDRIAGNDFLKVRFRHHAKEENLNMEMLVEWQKRGTI